MPDQDLDLPFPLHGLDAAGEFGRPPPGTTPRAANARAVEALTTRQRGGSRPGLSRYVPDPVGGISGPVQMLAVIVDPTVDAVLASFESWDPPGSGDPAEGVADPSTGSRNPGRLVRPGGSGVQPNRHTPQRRQAQHRQSKGATFDTPSGSPGTTRSDAVTLDQSVRRKSLVVVLVATQNCAAILAQPTHTVADSVGLTWHESPGSYEGPFPAVAGDYNGAARLWWAYADFPQDSRPLTVTVTVTVVPDPAFGVLAPNRPPTAVAVLEYTGVKFAAGGSTAALDDSAEYHQGQTTGTGLLAFDLGTPLDPSDNYGLLLGALAGVPGVNAAAPVAGTPAANPAFVVRLNVGFGSLVVVEATGGLAGASATPGVTFDYTGLGTLTAFHWAFLGASWQRNP